MTFTLPTTSDWKSIGTSGVCIVLNASGAILLTTGRVLVFCGLQLRALSAHIDPR